MGSGVSAKISRQKSSSRCSRKARVISARSALAARRSASFLFSSARADVGESVRALFLGLYWSCGGELPSACSVVANTISICERAIYSSSW